MDDEPAPAVAVTLGRCDEMRAEVLLRVDPPGAVSGTLTGPQRGRDTTLPVSARLEPAATPGLARAILTEPAYWTPDLPNLYRLRAILVAPGSPPRAIDRLLGLRRLGVRGRSLWLDGHRWVPRGRTVADTDGLAACKAAGLAAVVAEPPAALLARADELGVAVIAVVNGPVTNSAVVAERVAAWSAHPSAVLAILPADLPSATVAEIATAAQPLRGTLLLATTVMGTHPPPASIPPGIDALVVALDGDAMPHDAWRGGAAAPVIAWLRTDTASALDRTACDVLQATLAAWASRGRDERPWDWAGYLVGV